MGQFFGVFAACATSLVLNACVNLASIDPPKPHATYELARDESDSIFKIFEDLELKTLIQAALINNSDVAIYQTRIKAAQAQANLAESKLFPSLNAGASYQFDGDSKINANLMASWEIDLFGKFYHAKSAQDELLGAAKENLAAFKISLVSDVAAIYFNIRLLQNNIALTKRRVANYEALVAVMSASFEGGLVSFSDLMENKAFLQTETQNLNALQNDLEAKTNELRALIGDRNYDVGANPAVNLEANLSANLGGDSGANPSLNQAAQTPLNPANLAAQSAADLTIAKAAANLANPANPLNPSAPNPAPYEFSLNDFYANLSVNVLLNRPDIRAQIANLNAAIYSLAAARATMFPSISLSGSLSKILLSPLGAGEVAWQILSSLTLPIFSRAEIYENIRIADYKRLEAYYTLQKSLHTALGEIDNAIVSLKNSKHTLNLSAEMLANNEAILETLEKSHALGLIDFSEFIKAQNSHLLMQKNHNSAFLSAINATIYLYRAIGGNARDIGERDSRKDSGKDSPQDSRGDSPKDSPQDSPKESPAAAHPSSQNLAPQNPKPEDKK